MIITFEHSHIGPKTYVFHNGSSMWVYVCQGCGNTRRDALTPIDDHDEMIGQTLCETCCLSPNIGGGWPGFTLQEMRSLWKAVRDEQAREMVQQEARERSVATNLDDLKGALEKSIEFNNHMLRIGGQR